MHTILTIVPNIVYIFPGSGYNKVMRFISEMELNTKLNKNVIFDPSIKQYLYATREAIFVFLKSLNELLLNDIVPNYMVHSVRMTSSNDLKLNSNINLFSIIDPNKLTILNIGSCT